MNLNLDLKITVKRSKRRHFLSLVFTSILGPNFCHGHGIAKLKRKLFQTRFLGNLWKTNRVI